MRQHPDNLMRNETKTDQASIVLVGSFNPKIFHPAWLALHDLVSCEGADDALVTIVHPDITQFTAAYMTFDIIPSRFLVRCDAIYKDVIKDLVLAGFGEHLPHTPVWLLGINRSISFSCGSETIRDKLGNLLAPKKPWGPWGEEIEQSASGTRRHGGMTRMIMLQQPRPDGLNGHIQADLRPASDDLSALIVDVNNHFSVGDPEKVTGCVAALDVLRERWVASMDSAERIVDGIMATVEEIK